MYIVAYICIHTHTHTHTHTGRQGGGDGLEWKEDKEIKKMKEYEIRRKVEEKSMGLTHMLLFINCIFTNLYSSY